MRSHTRQNRWEMERMLLFREQLVGCASQDQRRALKDREDSQEMDQRPLEMDQTVSVHPEVAQEQRCRREGHQWSQSDPAVFRQRRDTKELDE
jgi:hypothetical protein